MGFVNVRSEVNWGERGGGGGVDRFSYEKVRFHSNTRIALSPYD